MRESNQRTANRLCPSSRRSWARRRRAVTYEIKLDGYRIYARTEKGDVRLYTRNGNNWTAKMPRLAHSGRRVRPTSAIGQSRVFFDGGTPEHATGDRPERGRYAKSLDEEKSTVEYVAERRQRCGGLSA